MLSIFGELRPPAPAQSSGNCSSPSLSRLYLLGLGKRKSFGGFRMKYSSVPRPQPLPGGSLRATGGGSGFWSLSDLGLFSPRYRGSLWIKICRVEEEACWRGLSCFSTKRETASHPHTTCPFLSMCAYVPQSYTDREMQPHSLPNSRVDWSNPDWRGRLGGFYPEST